jgi:hypothetical protein
VGISFVCFVGFRGDYFYWGLTGGFGVRFGGIEPPRKNSSGGFIGTTEVVPFYKAIDCVAARRAGPLAILRDQLVGDCVAGGERARRNGTGRSWTTLRTDVFVKRCASYVELLPITEAIAVRSVQFAEPYPAGQWSLEDRLIGATAVVR